MLHIPLPEKLRPKSLDEYIGQEHIVGTIKKLLTAKDYFPSLIFWGPPGSGKTTLARIIANEMDADFVEISAVAAGKADIMRVIERAKVNQSMGKQTVLFVDEIH